MIERPILAVKYGGKATKMTVEECIETTPYPVIGTPKVDGIRAYKRDGKLLSRSGELIRNIWIRHKIQTQCPDNLDGELVTYTDGKMDDFNTVQSKVMSYTGEPDFKWLLIDCVENPKEIYTDRLFRMIDLQFFNKVPAFVAMLPFTYIYTKQGIEEYENECLSEGYEGICLRRPDSPYKFGRSTWKEFYLAALTRWTRAEAEIIGIIEQQSNLNEAEISNLGFTKRGKSKEGMIQNDTMGSWKVRDIETGKEFKISGGVGVYDKLRKQVWNNWPNDLGRIITYKYKGYGAKDLPRQPQFVGYRHKSDM